MSSAFYPAADTTAEQALKVQELNVISFDSAMYSTASSSTSVLVREPVDKVYLASFKDDSANTVTQYAQASITITDSAGPGQTSGISHATGLPVSDRGAITIAGLTAVDANDVINVRYTVLQGLP